METVKTYKKKQTKPVKERKRASSITVTHKGKKVKFDIVSDDEVNARRNKAYKFLL